jgi:hypothetical protein
MENNQKPVLSSLADELGFKNAEQKKNPILHSLAKELGYKDYKEMKDALGKEQAGREDKGSMGNIGGIGGAGTGFLGGREVASGFNVGVKKRLAAGKGIKESLKGGLGEFKQSITLENIKRRGLEKTFGGSGFISSFARGKLKKRYAEKDSKKVGNKSEVAGKSPQKIKEGGTADDYISIIAKESMAIPPMARDVNVMRQNLQKLVKIWGGTAATKKEEEPKKEKVESSGKIEPELKERKEDVSWFAEQDKREAELEAGRDKDTTPTPVASEKKEEEKGNFLDSIISLFSKGFMKAIRFLFNPKMLMKVFSKVFLPAVIIGTLFKGIFDGFKKYQETGSFVEAIKSALGGMLSFLTFGIFGEETIGKLFDSISSFFEPITSTISNIFGGIKDFFIKLFGGKVDVKDESKKEADKVTPEKPAGKVGAAGTETKPEAIKSLSDLKTQKSSTPAAPTKQEKKQGDVLLKPDEEKSADPLISKMIDYQNQIKTLNDDYTIPKEEKKKRRTEIVKLQSETLEQLNKIKPGLGDKVFAYTQDQLINTKEETSKSLMEKMNQDLSAEKKTKKEKTPEKISAPTFTKTQTTTTKTSTTTGNVYTEEGSSAKGELAKLDEKYNKKAEPIIKKLIKEGKIDGVVTEDDWQTIPELKKLREEKLIERQNLESKMLAGETSATSKSTSKSSSVSTSGKVPASLSGSSGGGSVSASSGAASSGDVSAAPTVPSGGEISNESANVSEGQRMEASADAGSVVNAPTTNNNSSSSQKGKPKPASVYDDDLISTMNTY